MSRAPYKYLDYYTFDDADIFFGREEETQKMVGEILSTRLLVLFSPSGSGKTSLINAGVRPALEKLGYETVYVRLESDPIPSVQNAVAAVLALSTNNKESHSERSEKSVSISQAAASKEISRSARNDNDDVSQNDLHGFFKNVTRKTEKPLVVFIDQFEEFFIVFHDKPQLRQQFIEQVAKIKYDDQLPVFLVLSLREDYFANLHEFREAIPSIFQNNANLRLQPFDEKEAGRAIVEPAKAVRCEVEPDLVQQLLKDLNDAKNGHAQIEPIKLQIVCHTLWQQKPETAPELTAAGYNANGGAEKILQDHVEQLLQNVPLYQHRLMVCLFEALKTPDGTKRYRAYSDLKETLRISRDRTLKRLLDKLAGLNLLRREQRGGSEWYEFKHDYLVAKVVGWMQNRKEKINRRWRYGLTAAAVVLLYLFGVHLKEFFTFKTIVDEPGQSYMRAEIAIVHEAELFGVFGDTITTGLFEDDIRGAKEKEDLKENFKFDFGNRTDWQRFFGRIAFGGCRKTALSSRRSTSRY